LRLDLVAHKDDLKSTNTNASDTILGYLKNGGGTSPYPTSGVAYATSSTSWNIPYLAIEGSCYNTSCVNDPSTGSWNKDVIVANSPGSGSGKVGVYYNYCAASAGSYCYDKDAVPADVNDVTEDICPAGWRMPTGGADTVSTDGKGEYQALYRAYSREYTNFRTALSTPLSGYFHNGASFYNQGFIGHFWSSTRCVDVSSDMYDLYMHTSSVYPQYSNNRNNGYSVRCLLQ
jgi:uncharacterized protein (TIGR02145 family)